MTQSGLWFQTLPLAAGYYTVEDLNSMDEEMLTHTYN